MCKECHTIFKKIIIACASIVLLLSISACSTNTTNSNQHATPVTKAKDQPENADDKTIQLPDAELQKGDQGDEVTSLQKGLMELGYPVDATGKYAEKTIWAMTDIQFQTEKPDISGIYDKETKQVLHKSLDGNLSIEPEKGLPYVESSTTKGRTITGNPYEILVLVNKKHALPDDFLPEDLVTPDVRFPFTEDLPKKQMRKVAADALEDLFAAADKEDLDLFAQSGFRSYERQESIFASNVEKNGKKEANNFSARPGESEHQTGLTMDVTNAEVNFDLVIEFGTTPEGKWLKDHAADYGFIIRYPKGKEDVTKYQYEPWHIRYVGEKAAKEIMDNDRTLEEYLADL